MNRTAPEWNGSIRSTISCVRKALEIDHGPAPDRITVIVTADPDDFRKRTGLSAGNGAIYRAGIIYLHNPRLLNEKAFTSALAHEYTHHYLQGRPRMPLWLEESLCIWYADEQVSTSGVTLPQNTDELSHDLSSHDRARMKAGYAGAYLFIHHLVRIKGLPLIKTIVRTRQNDMELSVMYAAYVRLR